MRIPLFVTLGIAAAAAAAPGRSATLGEILDRLPAPELVRVLAGLPAERLATLQQLGGELRARQAGLVAPADADPAIAALLGVLAGEQADNARLPPATFRALLVLTDEVVGDGLRSLLADGRIAADSPILPAAAAWLEAVADSGAPHPDAGGKGPSNPCFENMQDCMEYCADLPTWLRRSECGLDCSLDFVACTGGAVGSVIGSAIQNARSLGH